MQVRRSGIQVRRSGTQVKGSKIPVQNVRYPGQNVIYPGSVADPDPVGSGPFSQIRIRSNFPDPDPVPDPDPTIKSHITRSKSNKLNDIFVNNLHFLNKTSKF